MIVPDFAAPLTGHRHWNVDAKGFLYSANVLSRWPARKAKRARCSVGGVQHFDPESGALLAAPRSQCSCGIYAYKPSTFDEYGNLPVGGKVALWGHIIEHESGYRAEFGYPIELVAQDERTAARLRFLYGVPTTVEARKFSTPIGTTSMITSIVAYAPGTSWGPPVQMPPAFQLPPTQSKRRRWWQI